MKLKKIMVSSQQAIIHLHILTSHSQARQGNRIKLNEPRKSSVLRSKQTTLPPDPSEISRSLHTGARHGKWTALLREKMQRLKWLQKEEECSFKEVCRCMHNNSIEYNK